MHIRPARRADAADLIILDDIASSGLATHVLFSGVRDGRYDRPLEFGRDGYAHIEGPFSWRNALVAEIDGDVAGMSLSFPLPGPAGAAVPTDPALEPLEALKGSAAGTPFIEALAVYSRHRGRGIGKALLRAEIARAGGAATLVTDSGNVRALALYRAHGFIERGRAPLVPFNDNDDHPRDWVLLERPSQSEETAHG